MSKPAGSYRIERKWIDTGWRWFLDHVITDPVTGRTSTTNIVNGREEYCRDKLASLLADPECAGHLDHTKWIEGPAEFKGLIRVTCKKCGKFIGYRDKPATSPAVTSPKQKDIKHDKATKRRR